MNCAGYNDKGITHPTEVGQKELLTEFYEQCGISPSTIDFVEAHGTGKLFLARDSLRSMIN